MKNACLAQLRTMGTWPCAAWVCVAALAMGCGSEVLLPGAAHDSDETAMPACNDLPARLTLANATSGTFIGDRLHLFAELGGVPRYVVLGFGEHGAWVAGLPDLDGPAHLTELRPGLHARLSGGDGSGDHADAIDTRDQAAPVIRATVPLQGSFDEPYASVFGAADEHLIFCMRDVDDGVEHRYLHALDLSDPDKPLIHGVPGNPCDSSFNRDAAAASGSIWMVWGDESDAEVFLASPDGAVKVAEYDYAPDGIHAYGSVLHAATDGSLVVFDPFNDSEFFLFELSPGGGAAKFNHAFLGATGPKRLLDVHDGLIYLATPDGVRAYAVDSFHEWSGEWADVSETDYAAEMALGEGLATPIAGSAALLVIVDAAGAVYAVPRDRSGTVAPLSVFEREPCR